MVPDLPQILALVSRSRVEQQRRGPGNYRGLRDGVLLRGWGYGGYV